MSVESDKILNALNDFRLEVKTDIKDLRQELRGDARKFESEVKSTLSDHEKRISAGERFRYAAHALTAALASVMSVLGIKFTNGG